MPPTPRQSTFVAIETPALTAARPWAVLWRAATHHREALRRVVGFLVVGAAGMALNSAITAACRECLGLHYLVAAVVATQVTSLCCFYAIERRVFPDARRGGTPARRALSFLAMNDAALALRGPLIYALTALLGVHYLVSNLASMAAFTLARYALSALCIWRVPGRPAALNGPVPGTGRGGATLVARPAAAAEDGGPAPRSNGLRAWR